jgi:hypothetical protein
VAIAPAVYAPRVTKRRRAKAVPQLWERRAGLRHSDVATQIYGCSSHRNNGRHKPSDDAILAEAPSELPVLLKGSIPSPRQKFFRGERQRAST